MFVTFGQHFASTARRNVRENRHHTRTLTAPWRRRSALSLLTLRASDHETTLSVDA
jgi:hypothetical protein